jgi:parallel beta-helix repeat protein
MDYYVARALVAGMSLVGIAASPSFAAARDIHVEPGASGDGSEDRPLGSIDAALGMAADGDTVLLHTGDYGDAVLEGEFGADTVVTAAAGQLPRLRTLRVQNARNLVVRGLSISLSHADPYAVDTMVEIRGSAPNVTLEDCDVFSVADDVTAGWSATDWADLPGTGISVRAGDVTIRSNRVRNVGYGISIGHDAPNALVSGNLVENFSRDGLRGIGDFGVFEHNLVQNAYDVDDHHDDMFQSWSVGSDGSPGTGVVRGVILRGNTFINFVDPDQPFAGAAQGIGCFDGFFEDWVIENNVVIVNHWHGITLLGARNTRVVNNTVLDNRLGERPGPPWIDVSAHKDGTPSENIVIRNNLAQTITLEANSSTEDHNVAFDDPASLFVDVAGHDLHLVDGASVIDTGSDDLAPATDHDGIPRPQGAGIDPGAFEWHDGTVTPMDAGVAPRRDGGSGGPGSRVDAGPDAPTGGADGGGCCAIAGRDPAAWAGPSLAGLLVVAALWRRRRRRRGRGSAPLR